MRERLFKLIFLTAMSVFVICAAVLSILLFSSVEQIGVLQLFVPLLVTVVLALVLSLFLAYTGAKTSTRFLEHIDFSRPDERDVEAEIKPLVRRLAEQNRQIRSQMEELERQHAQQDQMRREFTANVSHELKTPLTSISGFAELLRDGLVCPEDVRPFAGKICEEAQRLMVLVGDIIRLSRLEDSTQGVTAEPVDLQEIVDQIIGQLQPAAQRRQVTVKAGACGGCILAPTQIVEEIVYNLCDNAIQYNRPGGTVEICTESQENVIALTVADTGIGIPEQDLNRIFERFYRVDKSHSRQAGGTGLGLSIVKHGAARLGARIHIESQLGQGTTVTVLFPGKEPV